MNKIIKLLTTKPWVYKMKYKNSLDRFKIKVRDYSYELLFIWNSNDLRFAYLKYITLLIPLTFFIKYVRAKYYARYSFSLPFIGMYVHEEMRKYHTDLPRDRTESNNLNKMLYSKEYTLKY
jgi:hypothetical protein